MFAKHFRLQSSGLEKCGVCDDVEPLRDVHTVRGCDSFFLAVVFFIFVFVHIAAQRSCRNNFSPVASVFLFRSITHLHSLGLSRVVILEGRSFPGRKDLLKALEDPPMQIVELSNQDAIDAMGVFARKYPWDWAADIGMIPPLPATLSILSAEQILQAHGA